jgi:hypothetical protein
VNTPESCSARKRSLLLARRGVSTGSWCCPSRSPSWRRALPCYPSHLRAERGRRQCFVSGDPDETTTPHTIDTVGADCFLWATDYPHPDHPHTWVDDLTRYAQTLAPDTRAKLLGQNVRRIYRLAPTRR